MSGKGKAGVVEPDVKQDDVIQQLLVEINNNLLDVLEELHAGDDEGEYMFVQGTATTNTSQNITDLLAIVGHPVKGYVIKNDDLVNTLEVGHNIVPSVIDSNVQTGSARFYPIFAGEDHKEMFNRNVIRNVFIRTAGGTAPYRLWLLW